MLATWWSEVGIPNFDWPFETSENAGGKFCSIRKTDKPKVFAVGLLPGALTKILGWDKTSKKKSRLSCELILFSYNLWKVKLRDDLNENRRRLNFKESKCQDVFHFLRLKPGVTNVRACACNQKVVGKKKFHQPKLTSWLTGGPKHFDTG